MKPGLTYGELEDAVNARYASESGYRIRFIVQARGMGEDWPLCIGAVKPADRDVPMEVNHNPGHQACGDDAGGLTPGSVG